MALRRIEERRQKRTRFIMGVVVAFLMVMSGFGVYLSGRGAQKNGLTDTGITFNYDQNYQVYQAKINGQKLQFAYLPSSVSHIPVTGDITSFLSGASAFIVTFDPSSSSPNLQMFDALRYDFSTSLGKPIIGAITQESLLYALPLFTCANATAQLPAIFLEVAATPTITLDGYCLRIAGNESEFIQLHDRLLYEMYAVFNTEA